MNMNTDIDGLCNSAKQTNYRFFYIILNFLFFVLYYGSEFSHFQIILLNVSILVYLYKFN